MAFSTTPGFVNPNDQEVLGPTGLPGTDHGQKVYALRCQRCELEYGANGTDIAQRRCPSCGGGRPGFPVTRADVIEASGEAPSLRRNPSWTRDELILALDLYIRVSSPDEKNPQVVELSELLNQLWRGTSFGSQETLRNPTGVSMKLTNFRRFDPAYTSLGQKGLAHGSKADQLVWDEFAEDRTRLAATAAAIREGLVGDAPPPLAPDPELEAEASEGALLSRLHHYRERDSSLVRKRKAQALAQFGRLACEACDFDFGEAYGPRGDGYIEVHHLKALETLTTASRTKLSDLAILCANCHRMVHARRPWLSLVELKALVRR